MTSYPPPPGGPPAPGSPVPPPPASAYLTTQQVKPPQYAWLVPLAGVVGLVGAFTPWFRPEGTISYQGQTATQSATDAVHAWDDGKIGLLGPILLVVIGVGVLMLILGKQSRFARGSAHPFSSAGKAAIGAGVVALVCVVIAWFVVKSQYRFTDGGKTYGWSGYIKFAKASGVDLELSRGPQVGLWLTVAGGVIAIAGGVLLLLAGRAASTSAPTSAPLPPAPLSRPLAGQPYPPQEQSGAPQPYVAPQPYGTQPTGPQHPTNPPAGPYDSAPPAE